MRISRTATRVAAALAVALATAGLAACSAGGGQSAAGTGQAGQAGRSGQSGAVTISIVASTNVWGDIAGRIAGDAATVTSIIDDPNQDPHDYQADPRTQLALADASIVIENGGGYDDFVATMLKASQSDAVVINAVDISGFAATQGDELNEHVWYDYGTVIKVADAIEKALGAAAPSHASDFAANLAAFTTDVHGLQADVAKVKAAHAGTGVAITEPVPLYLLDAMGLVDRTPTAFSEAVEEETDVPTTVLNTVLDLFSSHEVALLVYNEQTTGVQTELVLAAAQKADVPSVPVQETLPDGKDYIGWQQGIIDQISQDLDR